MAEFDALSRSGVTLPIEATAHFPLPEQTLKNDTGINVLIDLAHQANFLNMSILYEMLGSLAGPALYLHLAEVITDAVYNIVLLFQDGI